MALLEWLAGGLGIGVAKGLVKIWFEDEPLVQESSRNLLDILKKENFRLRSGQERPSPIRRSSR